MNNPNKVRKIKAPYNLRPNIRLAIRYNIKLIFKAMYGVRQVVTEETHDHSWVSSLTTQSYNW